MWDVLLLWYLFRIHAFTLLLNRFCTRPTEDGVLSCMVVEHTFTTKLEELRNHLFAPRSQQRVHHPSHLLRTPQRSLLAVVKLSTA